MRRSPTRSTAIPERARAARRGSKAATQLGWRVDRPWPIAASDLVVDATLQGPGSDLVAEMAVRPLAPREVWVAGLSGRVAWPPVAALAPELDIAAQVLTVAVGLAQDRRSGAGRLEASLGFWTPRDGSAQPVPALEARIETVETGVRGVPTGSDRNAVYLAAGPIPR